MIPLPAPTPLGLPAPAYVMEAIYIASNALFHILFELSLGIALFFVARRFVGHYRSLPLVVWLRLRKVLPATSLLAIATAVVPLVMWYTLFGSVMYVGIQPYGAAWLVALHSVLDALVRVLGACALAGLLVAAVGYREERDESTIKRGYRLFIGFALARLIAYALTAASPIAVLLSGFAAGTAVLGLMRPRNAAWLLSSATLTALSYIACTVAELHEFKQRLAPLFYVEDLSVRWQTAPMVIFFIFTAAALVVVGMMIRWVSTPSGYKL